jgi:dTDP-4-dehydrorhamnose reductase
MKVLLFGSGGQIGHELRRTLLALGELVALNRQDVDLIDLENLRAVLYMHAPAIIVNAAAYTEVDKAESDELLAQKINADAVRVMADYARYNGSLLVHYSTDYVFDGDKQGAYLENDATNPLNVYGKTKRAGEEAVQQAGCHHLIFRTSWVYSAHGNNFVKTILRLAKVRDELNVVADQIGTPTSAELIADVTAIAIAAWVAGVLPEGLYHLTASGETSRYFLACYVVERANVKGVKLKLDGTKIHAIATEEYPLPAKRPKNSLLDNGKLTERLGFQMPDWTLHVERTLDQLIKQDLS